MVRPIDNQELTAKAVQAPRRPAESLYQSRASSSSVESTSFQRVLDSTINDSVQQMRFSKHAQSRLQQRGIQFGEQEMRKLQGAVEKAAAKGARDSLVLMDDLALVVSVRNRTVVTAVDAASRRGNVFTNIDSVVLTD